jgi:hypothetical protein
VLLILIIIVAGSLLLSGGIEVGCFYERQTLCEKGGNLKDMLGEIVALVALLLGFKKDKPPEE